MTDLEGTYLVWLDFREIGLSVDELEDLIIYKAGLWLDSGKIFGKAGEGFQRINVACPRATLTEALERIKKALETTRSSCCVKDAVMIKWKKRIIPRTGENYGK